MIALFCRMGFLDGQVNRKTKEHVSMPAGPEAKESPGFFDLKKAFFRSPNMVRCWQSNAKAKLRQVWSVTNSKTNVKEHVPVQSTEDRSDTKLRREDFARSILPWRQAPDQRQRSAGRYIYISWQKAKSTRNCGARPNKLHDWAAWAGLFPLQMVASFDKDLWLTVNCAAEI